MESQVDPGCEVDPETWFAPAGRAPASEIRAAAGELVENPIVDATLLAFSGLLAILNEERQVLAVNTALLEMLGVEDAEEILGPRPGEALGCVHHGDHAGGRVGFTSSETDGTEFQLTLPRLAGA